MINLRRASDFAPWLLIAACLLTALVTACGVGTASSSTPTPTWTATPTATPSQATNNPSATFTGALTGALVSPRWAISILQDGPGCLQPGEGDAKNAVAFAGSLPRHGRVWILLRLDGTADGTYALRTPSGSWPFLDVSIATSDGFFWLSTGGSITLTHNRQHGYLSAVLHPTTPSGYEGPNNAVGSVNLQVSYRCP